MTERRYPTLDLLRFAAISMVMIGHTPSVTDRVFFLRPFAPGFWMGVDLFMLISGWLLGGQLLREAQAGPIQQGRFYFKRWMRTLPAYYVMLVLLYVSAPAPKPSAYALAAHFTFLQVYLGVCYYSVSWSLCVEEHFYLLLPFLVRALGARARLLKIVAFVILAEAAALALRWPGRASPVVTHLRCHGLLVGLLFAFLSLEQPRIWKRIGSFATYLAPIGFAGTLLVFASIPVLGKTDGTGIWSAVLCPTLGTWTLALVFLPSVHEDSVLSRISFPGLQYLGELTYSLYLVHVVLPKSWLGAGVGSVGAVGALRRFVVVFGCAMLLHYLVERPFLRLRALALRRFSWRPAGAVARTAIEPGP